jgi:hypothetical protein
MEVSTSFSEEKEAKRLLDSGPEAMAASRLKPVMPAQAGIHDFLKTPPHVANK